MRVVLVVDDEPLVGMIVSLALEDAGFSVLQAFDGEHALKVMADSEVAVIVTDYMMPRRSGLGLAQAIAEKPAEEQVPVVLMSAVPGEVVAHHPGLFAAFLQKPADIDVLVDTVRHLIDAQEAGSTGNA